MRFRADFQKIQNLKKFERFNRVWPNSIPKFLDRYIIFIFMWSFRAIAQILRKLELPQILFKNSKFHKITNRPSIVIKKVTTKGLWLLFTGVTNSISISQMAYEWSGFKKLKIGHTHTHTHIHTFGRHLKITFFNDFHIIISKFVFTKT